YGPYSLAVESQYDHPHQWGSKRTGPDLARLGGKYSDVWHVAHLINPRQVTPESNMPAYPWLAENELDVYHLSALLRTQRIVGVPYTQDMIENAAMDAIGQATPGSTQARAVAERYGEGNQVSTFDGTTGTVTEMD